MQSGLEIVSVTLKIPLRKLEMQTFLKVKSTAAPSPIEEFFFTLRKLLQCLVIELLKYSKMQVRDKVNDL